MRATFAVDAARVLALIALAPACGRLPLAPREPDAGGGYPGSGVDARDAPPSQDAAPPPDAPSEPRMPVDGKCPDGFTACGGGDGARCYDLGRTSDHCGACGQSCAAGIACQAGVCQQHRCAGALSFKALASTPTSGALYGPALGDFDGDGILDLAGASDATGAMSLLYGAGDGTFAASRVIDAAAAAWQALAGDIDGDGRLDLASMSTADASIEGQFTLTVRRGSGDRGAPFGPPTTYPTGEYLSGMLLADFDGDGRLDLVARSRGGFEYRRGQEGGQFAAPAVVASPDDLASFVGIPVSSAVAADWNGDHLLDLVYAAAPYSSLHFRLGRGDGTFDAEVPCALAIGVIGDMDNDGRADVLSRPYLLLGLDRCNPKKVVPISDWPEAARASLADLDGDGNLDVVIDGAVSVRLGDGKGAFNKTLSLPGVGTGTDPLPSGAFLFGDVNGDGKLDIVYARYDGWRVFLNTCP